MAHFLHLMISVVFCLLISFLYGWELTLVVIAYVPVVSIINIFVTKVILFLKLHTQKNKINFKY